MVSKCCVCGKVRDGAQWNVAEPFQSTGTMVTWTYCPACAEELRELIEHTRLETVRPAAVSTAAG